MNGSIVDIALTIAIALVSLSMLLCGWRLLRGPERVDRILALDTLYIDFVAMVVLVGIHYRTGLFFEAALLIALLGFASTVALSRFLTRGDVIE